MKLIDDEQVYYELNPRLLTLGSKSLFWLMNVVLLGVWLLYKLDLLAFIDSKVESIAILSWFVLKFSHNIWIVPPVLCGLVIAVTRIMWREYSYLLVSLSLLIILQWFYPEIEDLGPRVLFMLSLLFLFYQEYVRVGTKYMVTNFRIEFLKPGFKTRSRTVFYSKIQDIQMHVGIFGKIFGYGTIIPITSSGLGTGAMESQVHVGGQVANSVMAGVSAGHSSKVIDENSEYALHDIPWVEEVHQHILSFMTRT
ncbi:MAG: PH domain-containing protein [Candidatus Cloacimonetes bacterium]|nr:PH domain-containing protein [Candidatus Cloacimonadota bacterium]